MQRERRLLIAAFANEVVAVPSKQRRYLMPTTLTKIPSDQVANVVNSFIKNDEATKITAEKEADGTWRVTAYLP
jgi:hypothetical protein